MKNKFGFIALSFLLGFSATAQVPTPAQTPVTGGSGRQTSAPGAPKAPPPSTTTAPVKAAAPASSGTAVAPGAPVITINLCKASTAPQPSCKKIITREEFDRLLETVAPNAAPDAKRSVANKYVQLLTAASVAERNGLDRQPLFLTKVQLSRLSLLAAAIEEDVRKKSDPSPQEITSYYQGNPAKFEQFTMRRLTVPNPVPAGFKYQGAAVTAKDLADKVQKRAAAGEDFIKLQSEILGTPVSSAPGSDPTVGTVTRGGLPSEYENRVLDMKPGQVSETLTDGPNYVIYKMDGKKMVSLDNARDAIVNILRQARTQQALQLILNSSSADYNDAYFGPAAPASVRPGIPAAPPK